MSKKHVLTVLGRYDEIQKICQFMAEGATSGGLSQAALFHIELACDEACTNIIEHAYGGENIGKIKASWQFDGTSFVIILQDNGRSFNPDSIPKPNLPTSTNIDIDNVKVGGLGIHFMRQLMDDVQFSFDKKTGNTLTLVKKKV
ncbi:MAG: ATP-binding protein [Chloroflexi bacterium]|nr:ATP-binding protein [Chloroflexota bacterium]